MSRERVGLLLGALLVLGAVNVTAWHAEATVRGGQRLLLALAPRDPRSILQGDYMQLNYDVAQKISGFRPGIIARLFGARPTEGIDRDWGDAGDLVLDRDARDVGTFARVDDGASLSGDQVRLHYRRRHGRVRIGTDAFYFEEGTADRYERARFGELRVDDAGESVLIGLLDEHLAPLGERLDAP